MPRALLSVYDKTGIVEFAQQLHELGWELVSSGGTAIVISAAGIPVIDVAEITGYPAEGADLFSPMNGEMRGKVNESLQSHLDIRFFSNGSCRYQGTGRHAGLEIAGNVEAMIKRN